MPWKEEELKQHLKVGILRPLYVLYGEERYLVNQYADKLRRLAMGGDGDGDMDCFNLHRIDGTRCELDEIEEAAEALPLMAERSCVLVRDYDVADHADTHERLLALIGQPADTCVLIFYYDALTPATGKSAAWKTFLAAAEKSGAVVKLDHRTPEDTARLLVAGAARRKCRLSPEIARLLVEWCGNDLNLLLGELDKLAALVPGGEIDRALVERAATRNLESRVFDLSKAILAGQYTKAYEVLDGLFTQKEDPIMINAVLAGAFADLYRAKVSGASGTNIAAVAEVYPTYKGKEFRLRNGARDAARLSVDALRQTLEVLAAADRRLKSTGANPRVILEETAARLIVLTRKGR